MSLRDLDNNPGYARIERHAKTVTDLCEKNKFLLSEMLVLSAYVATEALSKLPAKDRLAALKWYYDRVDSGIKEIPANG